MRDSPEALASIPVDRFSTPINRSAPFMRSLIGTPGHHPRIPGNQSCECRHILRNPTVTNSTDRAYFVTDTYKETRCRHPDVSTRWSLQSTKLGCKCCKHAIMMGVGERVNANDMLKSRGEVWRSLQRTYAAPYSCDCSLPALHLCC